MEIAVQEFSGYSSSDNNHIYDVVVSLRILKTETDVRTPDIVVLAGVTHMLERALVLQGLALVGHPSAAAFEVVVSHVGGLIEVTRDESKEKVDALKMKLAEAADKYKGLQATLDSVMAQLDGAEETIRDIMGEAGDTGEDLHTEIVNLEASLKVAQGGIKDLRDENETLRGEIVELEVELSTPATQ